MNKSIKISFFVLGVTSVVCSKLFFTLLNDPEGPNLLIVTVLSGIIFMLSVAPYSSLFKMNSDEKRFFLAILIQIALVFSLYSFLN